MISLQYRGVKMQNGKMKFLFRFTWKGGETYWFVDSVPKVLSAEIPTSCFYIKLNFIFCDESWKYVHQKARRGKSVKRVKLCYFLESFFMILEYFYNVLHWSIGKRLQNYMKSVK